jgi:hypothetical protein
LAILLGRLVRNGVEGSAKLPSFAEIEFFVSHVPERTRIGGFFGCNSFF